MSPLDQRRQGYIAKGSNSEKLSPFRVKRLYPPLRRTPLYTCYPTLSRVGGRWRRNLIRCGSGPRGGGGEKRPCAAAALEGQLVECSSSCFLGSSASSFPFFPPFFVLTHLRVSGPLRESSARRQGIYSLQSAGVTREIVRARTWRSLIVDWNFLMFLEVFGSEISFILNSSYEILMNVFLWISLVSEELMTTYQLYLHHGSSSVGGLYVTLAVLFE